MLDIKFVREHSEEVKENLKRRGDLDKIVQIDDLIRDDKNWRDIQNEANMLRNKRNRLTDEIGRLRRSGTDTSALVKEAEQIPDQIRKLEIEASEIESRVTDLLMRLPNMMHESVPFGSGENDNIEVKKWGRQPQFTFAPKDHIDLATGLKLIDLERAAKVAGARFYYLRGDLVKLNYALLKFALDFIASKGFTLIQPPFFLRREAIGGAPIDRLQARKPSMETCANLAFCPAKARPSSLPSRS